jgi:thioredoxin reductase (NADPH)
MTFFSTPDLLELGSIPFPTANIRPSRVEALEYYRKVADHFDLDLVLRTEIVSVRRDGDVFRAETSSGARWAARSVIFATGYFERPNRIRVAGEDLPHVSHYYTEPFAYARSRVTVVGGANSAVEASLDLYRHGADVTLVHRRAALSSSVKYWVRPDAENRIREGAVRTAFESIVTEIRPGEVDVQHLPSGDSRIVPSDFVLLLTGYRPDDALLRKAGIEVDDETLVPTYDPETFETNVPGLFVAGSSVCGCETGTIFIENGRHHARGIFPRIRATRLRAGG